MDSMNVPLIFPAGQVKGSYSLPKMPILSLIVSRDYGAICSVGPVYYYYTQVRQMNRLQACKSSILHYR